jgi:undecaprenyl-diphosphatase
MKTVSLVGEPVSWWLLLLPVVAWLLYRRLPRLAAFVAVTMLGSSVLNGIVKSAVDRARPVLPDPISHARGASFPSGHATGAAAFYLALAVVALSFVPARRRRLVLAAAVVVPLVVAATRVVLGVHYLTDVAAGLLLGWGWVLACTALFSAWRAEEGRPAPVLEEGLE